MNICSSLLMARYPTAGLLNHTVPTACTPPGRILRHLDRSLCPLPRGPPPSAPPQCAHSPCLVSFIAGIKVCKSSSSWKVGNGWGVVHSVDLTGHLSKAFSSSYHWFCSLYDIEREGVGYAILNPWRSPRVSGDILGFPQVDVALGALIAHEGMYAVSCATWRYVWA